MEKEKICPYCHNSGQIKFLSEENKKVIYNKYGKPIDEYCYYTCLCINNKVVSRSFNKLLGIPDVTLDETVEAGKVAGFRNLVIYGNEQKFLHLVKAIMVLHANYHRTFELLNGLELVQKYYISHQLPNEVPRSLTDLEKKNLVIFMFDSAPENRAQNTTVFEVMKSRLRMNDPVCREKKECVERPTWVYASTKEALAETKEYSSDAGQLLKTDFTWLDLCNYKTSFKPNGPDPSKKRSNTQDNVGDL